jgi:LmbE family N-acetylglucosaminyl deacetylase
VFAPGEPTAFAGRGTTASQELDTVAQDAALPSAATTVLDVSAYVERKIAAIAAHRTQYPIGQGILPFTLLQEMMGREYFVRVAPARELETELLTRGELTPAINLEDQPRLRAAA